MAQHLHDCEADIAFIYKRRPKGQANVVEAKTWLDDDDLFLRPDPVGIETLDFNQLGEAERRGREAAEAIADQLRALSVSEEEYARHLAKVRRSKAEFTAPMVIDRIAVTGTERVRDELVLRRLHTVAGQPLDLDVLQEDLNRVYRLGEFSRVSYDIDYLPTDDGAIETVLVILTVEQERGLEGVPVCRILYDGEGRLGRQVNADPHKFESGGRARVRAHLPHRHRHSREQP